MQMWSSTADRRRSYHPNLLAASNLSAQRHPLIDSGWIEMGVHCLDLRHCASTWNAEPDTRMQNNDDTSPRAVSAYILSIHDLAISRGKDRLAQVVATKAKVPVLAQMIV